MQTSVNPKAFGRLTLIMLGSFGYAMYAPALPNPDINALHLVVALVFVVTVGVLLMHALNRRQRLLDAVRVELNKLRRLYHVSKNLSQLSGEFRPWFTELHGHIYKYMSRFAEKDFSAYDSFNRDFREISYHVYTIPAMSGAKEQALFADLLRTTSTVAEARQLIKELWDNRLSFNVWVMILLLTMSYIGAVTVAMPETMDGRLAGGFAVAAGCLAIDLLWKIDSLATEQSSLAKRYVDNVAKLELGRRE